MRKRRSETPSFFLRPFGVALSSVERAGRLAEKLRSKVNKPWKALQISRVGVLKPRFFRISWEPPFGRLGWSVVKGASRESKRIE